MVRVFKDTSSTTFRSQSIRPSNRAPRRYRSDATYRLSIPIVRPERWALPLTSVLVSRRDGASNAVGVGGG